jgi:peptidoglycan/LPS O-acetylase OafA/YrhL
VAVVFVMAFHYIPGVDRYAPLGSIGVRLFFVLSGFLITRILLDWRGRPLGDALRTFYVRRSLRIFPLFYLVLLGAAVANLSPVRSSWEWHAGYLTNVYLFLRGDWHHSISHLWSLAVEEQFYLVWPCIVLLLPASRLPWLLVCLIVVAPISRLLIGGPMTAVLPTSCLDSLGIGALLAIPATAERVIAAGRMVGIPLLIGATAIRYAGWRGLGPEVLLDFSVALAGGAAVGLAARGFTGLTGSLLSARPVVYIGTISYGLYLIHGFMPYALGHLVSGLVGWPWPFRAALLTLATLATAALSWHVVEAPILGFKDRLSYWQSRPKPRGYEAA